MKEAEFQSQVIILAKLRGFRVAHFRSVPVLHHDGTTRYQTPVQADGAGFPDLLLIHPKRGKILAVELKVGRNRATAAQFAWLEAFRAAGVEAYLWTPEDWTQIVEVLGDG